MGIFKLFGGNNGKSRSDGHVFNIELINFMREAFGRNITRLRMFDMPQYAIEFMLIDNDLLVTSGLSSYAMHDGMSELHFELAIRVPYQWKRDSDSLRHTWFVKIIQSIIENAISGAKPIKFGYLHVFESPFYYISDLNSVTLYNISEKRLQNGTIVDFMMVVPLYESELDDDYYLQESSDLKGLAWQQASLLRGNEYFETLDDYYPYDDTDTEAMSEYFAIRDQALPGWKVDTDAVGCRVSSGILNSKNKIGYMYRTRPDGDFSGWYFLEVESAFLTGSDDLPLDYYADTDSDLFTVAFLFPKIARYLKSLPGSAFELIENGEYVHVK